MDITTKFEEFIKSIEFEIKEGIISSTDVGALTKTYINESRVTLSLVEPYLENKNIKILEVGAGLGVFSAFLKSEGYFITALEPTTGGFEVFGSVKKSFFNNSDMNFNMLNIKAEDLDIMKHGSFDLIFSNNVIEHIPKFERSMSAMVSVLNENGVMIHACPNYLVPYEPHFRIPVLAFFPSLSKLIFTRRVNKNIELWDSLNFVTALRVKKLCKSNNLNVNFSPGFMHSAFERLDNDDIYKDRQSSATILIIWRIIKMFKLNYILKKIPAIFSTPMRFEIRRGM